MQQKFRETSCPLPHPKCTHFKWSLSLSTWSGSKASGNTIPSPQGRTPSRLCTGSLAVGYEPTEPRAHSRHSKPPRCKCPQQWQLPLSTLILSLQSPQIPTNALIALNPGTSCFSAVDWACWLAVTHRSRQWDRATHQRMDAPYRGLSLGSSPMSWDAWVATSPLYHQDACPRSVREGGQWGRARAAAERRARLKS